jgi:hypothetical protein
MRQIKLPLETLMHHLPESYNICKAKLHPSKWQPQQQQHLEALELYGLHTVWKTCAMRKCKFPTTLTIQNIIWTGDHFKNRMWPNVAMCPLRKHEQEATLHLFSHSKSPFGFEAWSWIGLNFIHCHLPLVTIWSIKHWSLNMSCESMRNEKEVASQTMLFLERFGRKETQGSSSTLPSCL